METTERERNDGPVAVYHGDDLSRYGFGFGHPFGTDRQASFWNGMTSAGLVPQVAVADPVVAARNEIERFHTSSYVDRVVDLSRSGDGFLDSGVRSYSGW